MSLNQADNKIFMRLTTLCIANYSQKIYMETLGLFFVSIVSSLTFAAPL